MKTCLERHQKMLPISKIKYINLACSKEIIGDCESIWDDSFELKMIYSLTLLREELHHKTKLCFMENRCRLAH